MNEKPDRRTTGNGVHVILITGVLGCMAFFAANRNMQPIDWVLLGLVVVLTVGGGIALARFIRANPGATGEARFDTSHPDDPQD